ncbi:hypothetical protein Y1Q_0024545 [Alligator mississippiensis]|uniref:Uncharacterized protein n=1 Tax=Alligator mississippiensis TaxID=8496 RepID=A0A151NAU3_ALLMI|nr:hypothetical protein Y1Q_0024545 [Alligator mississippiensis]
MEPRHFVFSSWEVERSVVPWSVPDSTFVCGRPRHRSRDAGSRVVPQTPTEHWRHINHFGLILKTVGASTHAVNAIEYTPAQFEPEANINKGSEEIMHVKSLKAFLNKMKYMLLLRRRRRLVSLHIICCRHLTLSVLATSPCYNIQQKPRSHLISLLCIFHHLKELQVMLSL